MAFSWNLRLKLSSHEELGFLPPLLLLLAYHLKAEVAAVCLAFELSLAAVHVVRSFVFYTGRRTDRGKGGLSPRPYKGRASPLTFFLTVILLFFFFWAVVFRLAPFN